METKDWVTLFVPIFMNGIILFFFQKHIDKQYERRQRNDERKELVKNKFHEKVFEARDYYVKLKILIDGKRDIHEIMIGFSLLTESLNEASQYCEINGVILEKYIITMTKLNTLSSSVYKALEDNINSNSKELDELFMDFLVEAITLFEELDVLLFELNPFVFKFQKKRRLKKQKKEYEKLIKIQESELAKVERNIADNYHYQKPKSTYKRDIMTIVAEDGSKEKVEVILAFEFKDNKKEYVVYTKGEIDEEGNTTVYVSNVNRINGSPELLGVESEKEWIRIKDVLRELSDDLEEKKNPRKKVPQYSKDGIEIL